MNIDRTLGELVRERPELAGLFDRLQLDYCCGGHRTLAEASATEAIHKAMAVTDAEHPRNYGVVSTDGAVTGRLVDRQEGDRQSARRRVRSGSVVRTDWQPYRRSSEIPSEREPAQTATWMAATRSNPTTSVMATSPCESAPKTQTFAFDSNTSPRPMVARTR